MVERGCFFVVSCCALLGVVDWACAIQLVSPANGARSEFRVLELNQNSTYVDCAYVCRRWMPGGYVAVVTSQEDNDLVHHLASKFTCTMLGAYRAPLGSRDSTNFRWVAGPLRGKVLWTTLSNHTLGRCHLGMYCNFKRTSPDNRVANQRQLAMCGESGQWEDANERALDSCACRRDPYDVTVVTPDKPTMEGCRAGCKKWNPRAYVATILSPQENSMVASLLENISFAVLGATRLPDNPSDIEARRFRWTEGPLGAYDGGKGVLLWTTNSSFQVGTCAAGMYCNFAAKKPDNANLNQVVMVISGVLEARSNTIGAFDDRRNGQVDGCVCRLDVDTASTSVTMSRHTAFLPSATVSHLSRAWSATFSLSITRRATFSATFPHSPTQMSASCSSYSSTISQSLQNVSSVSVTDFGTTKASITASFTFASMLPTTSVSESFACLLEECQLLQVAANASRLYFLPETLFLIPIGAQTSPRTSQSSHVYDTSGRFTIASDDVPFDVMVRKESVLCFSIRCGSYPLPLRPQNISAESDTWQVIRVYADTQQIVPSYGGGSVLGMQVRPAGNASSWVSGSLPFRQGSVVRVVFTVECGGPRRVSIAVPVRPRAAPALVTVVGNVQSGLQWIAALGAASSGGSVGRVAAIRRLALCSPSEESTGGLLGLSLPLDSDAEYDEVIAFARGAIAGNCLVILAASLTLLGVSGVYAWWTHQTIRDSVLRVALPSSLYPLWIATVQSTASALALLAGSLRLTTAVDVALMFLAAVVLFAPLSLVAVLPLAAHRWFGLSLVPNATGAAAATSVVDEPHSILSRCIAAITLRLTFRTARWRSALGPEVFSNSAGLHRTAWVLLCDHTALWFCALDALVLMTTSVLASVSGLGSLSLCRTAAVLILILLSGELCACLVVRPYAVPAANDVMIVMLFLTIVSLMIQTAALFSHDDGGPSPGAIHGAAIVTLAVLGITICRLCAEILALLRSLQRFLRDARLERHSAASLVVTPFVGERELQSSFPSAPPLLGCDFETAVSSPDDEKVFGGNEIDGAIVLAIDDDDRTLLLDYDALLSRCALTDTDESHSQLLQLKLQI